jgi:hypothetical protein
VRQRTQIMNGIRDHMAEYGYVAPKGVCYVERLLAEIEDPASDLPPVAVSSLKVIARNRACQSAGADDADKACGVGRDSGGVVTGAGVAWTAASGCGVRLSANRRPISS